MSIQPHRVIARIVDQVDRSDWPELESLVLSSADGRQLLRFFAAPALERYATPLHFWVHALRDELAWVGQRGDLVGAAGHALCRDQRLADWCAELDAFALADGRSALEALGLARLVEARDALALPADGRGAAGSEERPHRVYRMLESACRRSSVVGDGRRWMAHFWGHGARPSWRRTLG